ncbi:hypothetical protein Dalk_1828 [Desulfatibacillum aliphaticivorans]|uniref:Uncharacterized protein n=1 Tax=Desulfatibacillum aliphaticivorans TaxID=218208 RepID=B8FFX0_DESAL|nr:hypothetical protein Dalk_1828 [Desulfatibacillum aliphaticivorans]
MSLAFKTTMLTTEDTENTENDLSVASVFSVVYVFLLFMFFRLAPMLHVGMHTSASSFSASSLKGSEQKPLPCARAKTEILCFRPLFGGLPNQLNYCFFPSPPSFFRVIDFLTDVPKSL